MVGEKPHAQEKLHRREHHRRDERKRRHHRQRVKAPARRLRTPVRRHAIRRQINHQPVNENPHRKLRHVLRSAGNRLHQGAGQTEQEEHGERGKRIAPQNQRPGQEQRRDHHHAVQQHHVEIIRGRRDVGLASLHAEQRRQVGHRGRDDLLQQGERGGEHDEFRRPPALPSLHCRADAIAIPDHQAAAQADPENDQARSHPDHGAHVRVSPDRHRHQAGGQEQPRGEGGDQDCFPMLHRPGTGRSGTRTRGRCKVNLFAKCGRR